MLISVSAARLTKTYGKTRALNGLNFKIEAGSVYGLVGTNGAGKTTTLAILAGLIRPDSGAAWILGKQIEAGSSLRSNLGFSSPQYPPFDYLTGFEMLSACGLMHGLAREEVKKRSMELMEMMDLQSAAGQYASHYSQGMRQKLGLACALIHAPDVLLLDEPFLGLDPASNFRLVCTLERIAANGKTVVLSSHNMTLVERLCHRAGILHKGVLQREVELASKSSAVDAFSCEPGQNLGLETALWEIIGTPEPIIPSWI